MLRDVTTRWRRRREKRSQQRALRGLNDHTLKDIGLHREKDFRVGPRPNTF